jgi:MFS family permease
LFFFGRIADMFGRKSLFIGSFAAFAVLCLGTGFSRNAITVDVLNGILGLASAAAVPPAQGMLGVIYERPSKRKNLVFACFSAGNPLGFVFGCISSGIAAQIFNWRASYYFLAILFAIFTICAVFSVPPDHADKEPLTSEALQKFDVVGTALTIGGIGMFACALRLVYASTFENYFLIFAVSVVMRLKVGKRLMLLFYWFSESLVW